MDLSEGVGWERTRCTNPNVVKLVCKKRRWELLKESFNNTSSKSRANSRPINLAS
jgi:hypothetical protein